MAIKNLKTPKLSDIISFLIAVTLFIMPILIKDIGEKKD